MQLDLLRLPAAHPLRPFVHSIFHVRRPAGAAATEAILPKGNVDILFNLGEPLTALGASSAIVQATGEVQLAGVQTAPFASVRAGEMNLVGLSLRMERAFSLLPLPQNEIVDARVDLGALLPDTRAMPERLAATQDFGARGRLLLDWVSSRVRPPERDALIAHACRSLRLQPSEAGVTELARGAGMSARHFQRLFTAAVGVAPSRYAKLQRFIRALHLVRRLPTLTDVAHAAGYTDHAHLCRDFREFGGMTPDTYRRHPGPVPGHALLESDTMSDSYKPRSAGFDIMPEQEALTDDEPHKDFSRHRPGDGRFRLRQQPRRS